MNNPIYITAVFADQPTIEVHIDDNGYKGTKFPIGTAESPVNNLKDALTIIKRLCLTNTTILHREEEDDHKTR